MHIIVYNEWKSPMSYPFVFGPFNTLEEATAFAEKKAEKLLSGFDDLNYKGEAKGYVVEKNESGEPVFLFNDNSSSYLMISTPCIPQED